MKYYVVTYNSFCDIQIFEFESQSMAECYVRTNELSEFAIIQGELIEKSIN